MGFKWSDQETENFLIFYKEHSHLWDFSHPLYKNRSAREAAYNDIIDQLNIPDLTMRDIMNKIKTVRTNYKFELNKVLKSQKDATNPSDVYEPHLFWFKKVDVFLRKVILNKAMTSHLDYLDLVDDISSTILEDTLPQQPSETETSEIKVEDTSQQGSDVDAITPEDDESRGTEDLSDAKTEKKNSKHKNPYQTRSVDSKFTQELNSTQPFTASKNSFNLPSDTAPSRSELSSLNNQRSVEKEPNVPKVDARSYRSEGNYYHRTRKRSSEFFPLERSINKIQKTLEQRKDDDDEFDLFGKSIALQLKRMPLERALICQENLQRVINQERLYQNK